LIDPAPTKRTPLHGLHVAAGARMIPFAGWDMPVQYTSVVSEHLAVRERAGMFDVSHMGEAAVRGPEALAFLQHVTSNDVAKLVPGRVHYTALTTPEGTFVDDLLVYMLGEADYLLVVNAANTAKDLDWLRYHAKGLDVAVEDESAAWSQIALQGPRAAEILQPLTAAGLSAMKYYAFERAAVAGAPSIVSRTGYTGEDGFELYAPAGDAVAIWSALLAEGGAKGLVPVGLAARDTLRLEAKMALYGNDIDETTTVLEADLGWIAKLDKGEFLGREALLRQRERGLERKLAGFAMEGRAVARHGYPVEVGGERVGAVTSGSYAPFLGKSIGLAYLPRGSWEPGTRIGVVIRGKSEPAAVVPTPFYKRA
jgi:glycine cleavage system T protein (aminomethyltransferase)